MHHHRIETHQFHQHDVARETIFQLVIFHGVTAVFDHKRLTGKTTDIGQRFGENMRYLRGSLGIKSHNGGQPLNGKVSKCKTG